MSARTIVMVLTTMILMVSAPAVAWDSAGTPTWYPYGGHMYALTDTVGNWAQTEADAQTHSGHLVTINDANENAWLLTTFGTGQMWIGFRQLPGTSEPFGDWQWISGEPVTYTNWRPTQPDEWGSGDDYALMNVNSITGTWDDVSLSGWFGPHPGIIEMGTPVAPVADAGGPYTVSVGDPLIVSAAASTDLDNDIVLYEWDLNDDGDFETDAGGSAFLVVDYSYVASLGLGVGGPYDIDVRVTDSMGLYDVAGSQLTIVPEPATLSLLALGGVALLKRRSRLLRRRRQ